MINVLTLAFDTSTKSASVALLRDTSILVERLVNVDKNHGETLLPEIMNVLAMANVVLDDVELFAVTTGPGSFTGLRIGAATVKGLAVSADRPIAGVSSLDALAFNIPYSSTLICPMLDARKQEVYTALYRPRINAFPERILDEQVVAPGTFLENIDDEVIFLGDGAQAYEDIIKTSLPGNAHIAPRHLNYIRASSVGLIGLKKFYDGDTLDTLTFAPRYLRVSEAEAKRMGTGNKR